MALFLFAGTAESDVVGAEFCALAAAIAAAVAAAVTAASAAGADPVASGDPFGAGVAGAEFVPLLPEASG
ncbi:MAG: hypothetical protein WB772_10530 [Xanthobacteraceae bacterium]